MLELHVVLESKFVLKNLAKVQGFKGVIAKKN